MIGELFNSVFFEPILALLVFIYENVAFEDLGLAIIALTVLIRAVLLPFFYKSSKDQTLIQRLQPHIEKIKHDHKNDREKQGKALMALYREHKLNPFSGFLILLIQLPVFIAIFKIFRSAELIAETFDNSVFLSLIDLGERSLVLVVFAAALQYFQGKMTLSRKKPGPAKPKSPFADIGRTMVYFAPILSFMILVNLPSALALYWGVSTLFSLGQQIIINKKLSYIDHGTNFRKNEKGD